MRRLRREPRPYLRATKNATIPETTIAAPPMKSDEAICAATCETLVDSPRSPRCMSGLFSGRLTPTNPGPTIRNKNPLSPRLGKS